MASQSAATPAIETLHDNVLKRRLLGAAVLIALAVIFLPLIFDGAGTESQFRSIEPLTSEPPYDLEIMQEGVLPELSGSTVVEFVEDRSINELPAEGNELAPEPAINVQPATEMPENQSDIAVEPVPAPAPIKKTEPVSAPTPSPEPSAAAAGRQSWLIQTASFKDKINALSLRSDLKKTGYPVQVKVAELGGQSVFRVYVGPIDGEQEASRVKASLDKKLDRNTLLVAE
ncbi:MAG: SPOR domain-containing protein [Gammaproteobacteria bacterium]|nr:SPOR domain-containing protein [Gammaproteobacteria bacterium]